MSQKQDEAEQKAFRKGQDDWRENKFDNPYPPTSTYHDFWQQGQDAEDTIQKK
jgi:phosphatidylethanolamine-binding protein (PEBP) family uncharacterized protein